MSLLRRFGGSASGASSVVQRLFSTSTLRSEIVRIPKVAVEAQSATELVKFKSKTVNATAEDMKPLREAQMSNLPMYARIHMHNWNLLVTPGDIVKLPVNMKDVKVGDKLNFTECSEIGTRTHTLSSGGSAETTSRIDPSLFSIKGVVLEKTRVKRTVTERTRRRRRHVRHVVANNKLTVIRISDVEIR